MCSSDLNKSIEKVKKEIRKIEDDEKNFETGEDLRDSISAEPFPVNKHDQSNEREETGRGSPPTQHGP